MRGNDPLVPSESDLTHYKWADGLPDVAGLLEDLRTDRPGALVEGHSQVVRLAMGLGHAHEMDEPVLRLREPLLSSAFFAQGLIIPKLLALLRRHLIEYRCEVAKHLGSEVVGE